jgi:hypothetical protein
MNTACWLPRCLPFQGKATSRPLRFRLPAQSLTLRRLVAFPHGRQRGLAPSRAPTTSLAGPLIRTAYPHYFLSYGPRQLACRSRYVSVRSAHDYHAVPWCLLSVPHLFGQTRLWRAEQLRQSGRLKIHSRVCQEAHREVRKTIKDSRL